ncbi:PREDICTED: agamous-like MADS-box protein AGL49 [Camelina sativa]|uniref:Agamous-like MADS-box protein AGL49 n=1 Tax=Camelina sativa TaxID=90675 RepID=A0ABM1Q739_CAMSA|nr:PREDICTED: agamous-like MADS-box protein AGL49 [Camelina sativa]
MNKPTFQSISKYFSLSCDELRNHLVNIDSHLLGIKPKKINLLRRGNSKKPNPKEAEEDDHPRVSNNTTISNCNVASLGDRLGFDELGFRGSHETVSSLGSSPASKVYTVSDSSVLNPLTLGLYGSDYFPVVPMPLATDNFGFCANEGAWDLCRLDLEIPPTLFPVSN